MEGQQLNRLSHIDEADVCNTLQSALGRPPSVALARKLSKLVFIMQVGGSPDAAKELAYQTMNVIEVMKPPFPPRLGSLQGFQTS
jgi:hypothetical protein